MKRNILKENMRRFNTKNLDEAYAWERNEDGSLPTLKDTTKQHRKNIGEQEFESQEDSYLPIKQELIHEIRGIIQDSVMDIGEDGVDLAIQLYNAAADYLNAEGKWKNKVNASPEKVPQTKGWPRGKVVPSTQRSDDFQGNY